MGKMLTAEEEAKLSKIINEDSSIWTAKGYDSGILCEDSHTPSISYSSKAEKNRREIERVVEMGTELELSKHEKALKMALSGYDTQVLQEVKEYQRKYDSLLGGLMPLKSDVRALKEEISSLRRQRSSLKSQKKKLDIMVKKLVVEVEAKSGKVATKAETIGSLEV